MPRKQRFKPSRKQPANPAPAKSQTQSQPPDKHEEVRPDDVETDIERDMHEPMHGRDIERDQ